MYCSEVSHDDIFIFTGLVLSGFSLYDSMIELYYHTFIIKNMGVVATMPRPSMT